MFNAIALLSTFNSTIDLALGLNAEQLNLWQMGLRAIIIYLSALIMVRIVGDRRFIGKYAAFDVILSIILGSTLSRGINGTSAFFATIFAGFVLVAMHWLFSSLSFRFSGFENYLKGRSRILIRDGQLCSSTMKSCHITREDLLSTLRSNYQTNTLKQVEKACLERNGDISFSFKEENNS